MGAVLAVALLATAAWDATQNTTGIVARVNAAYTMAKGAYLTLGQTPVFFNQMVGLLGWNDVHSPDATTQTWYGAVAALLLAAAVLGDRREWLVLAALAVLTVLFPIAFEAYSGGRVAVRQIFLGRGGFVAEQWGSDGQWYDASEHDARFVITEQAPAGGMTPAQVESSLGTPAAVYQVDGYSVLVYSFNLLTRGQGFRAPAGS